MYSLLHISDMFFIIRMTGGMSRLITNECCVTISAACRLTGCVRYVRLCLSCKGPEALNAYLSKNILQLPR